MYSISPVTIPYLPPDVPRRLRGTLETVGMFRGVYAEHFSLLVSPQQLLARMDITPDVLHLTCDYSISSSRCSAASTRNIGHRGNVPRRLCGTFPFASNCSTDTSPSGGLSTSTPSHLSPFHIFLQMFRGVYAVHWRPWECSAASMRNISLC